MSFDSARHAAARLLVLLLASSLQFHQLGRDLRFHPDEAHFMTFARDAAVKGEWMLAGALDKPPLSIYLSAMSMVFLGVTADADGVLHLDPLIGEFAGRLPNVMLAILVVAMLMRLTWHICCDEPMTLLAGLLAALSPNLLAFGATAFSDMSLLFCLVLALLAIETRRYGLAGIAVGLSVWCKPQALFLFPLFVSLSIFQEIDRPARFRVGTVVVGALALLLIWDGTRPETSVFVLGAVNNAPDGLLRAPGEWLPRLVEWARLGSWLIAAPAVTVLLLGLAGLVWLNGGGRCHLSRLGRGTLGIFLGYFVAYIGLHTVFAFNQYDRYLLPLLPLAIVPLAALLSAMYRQIRYGRRIVLMISMVLMMTTVWSLRAGLPVGGDRGEHTGIDSLARHLNRKPVATVIYDPWLGWELGYYLGVWQDKRRVHYPNPAALVAGALALDEDGDRFLVALVNRRHDSWLDALRMAGFAVEVDYASERFVVYRIVVVTHHQELRG